MSVFSFTRAHVLRAQGGAPADNYFKISGRVVLFNEASLTSIKRAWDTAHEIAHMGYPGESIAVYRRIATPGLWGECPVVGADL